MYLVDQYMCSTDCPCPQAAEAKYINLQNTEAGATRFRAAGRYMDGLVTDTTDKTALVFTNSGTTYEKYNDCYSAVLETKFKAEADDSKVKKSFNEFKKGGLEYFLSLETNYKCGGICDPSLFFVATSVSDGPPTKDCVDAITDEGNWDSNYGVAIVAFATAIIMIFAAIAGIPLCRGFSKKRGDGGGGCCQDKDDMMNSRHS